MLDSITALVCPWCGETFERNTSTDPEPDFETTRSEMMAVLRMRQAVNAGCPKCGATMLITMSMEQLWNIPPAKEGANGA